MREALQCMQLTAYIVVHAGLTQVGSGTAEEFITVISVGALSSLIDGKHAERLAVADNDGKRIVAEEMAIPFFGGADEFFIQLAGGDVGHGANHAPEGGVGFESCLAAR